MSLSKMQDLEAGRADGEARPERTLILAAILLFLAALAAVAVRGIRSSAEPFDYPHAYVSADLSILARNFARQGILHLHAVPVDNNPPLRNEDYYPHWPPLLPILLGLCFRTFGTSERVAHLLMLCLVISTALLLFRLGQCWLGTAGGALTGFFYLTLPVTLQFGHLVSQQSLMTLFLVGAVLALMQGKTLLAAGLIFLGALAAWEIVLVVPGLLLVSRWHPELRRGAIASAIGAGAGAALVAAVYLVTCPGLAIDTLHTARFYMGLSTSYSHLLPEQNVLRPGEQVSRMLVNNVWMLGPLALGAILQLFVVRVPGRALLLASLATPWLVWCIAMRNHMARHPFEFAVAAPLAALALAWLATSPAKRPALKMGLLVALACLQMLLLPSPVISDGYDPAALIRYADGIRQHTEPNAIVLAPLVSMVPVYYADRHIIRGIANVDAAKTQLPSLRQEFPGSPIYLAVPPFLAQQFAGPPVAASNADLILLRLSSGDGGN